MESLWLGLKFVMQRLFYNQLLKLFKILKLLFSESELSGLENQRIQLARATHF